MAHLGDLTKLNGGELPPVDIITFGSPCQDLSTANGKRQGLEGARSGLFMEAIRIIKEMRGATNGKYPRYAVFENVTGAFSSAGGSDFRQILQAFCEIRNGDAPVPLPAKGKWAKAAVLMGDGYSVAYRTLCAEFWGVPQRRRRIFLVADFGGASAGKILFERAGLSGNFEPGGPAWQSLTPYAQRSAGGEDSGDSGRNCLNPWDTQQSRVFTEHGCSPTLAGADGAGGRNPAGLVCAAFSGGAGACAGGIGYSETAAPTLKAASGSNMVPCLCQPEVYALCGLNSNSMLSDNPNSGIYKAETSRTLDQNGGNPACNQGGMLVCEPEIARTLTARGDSSPCADRGQNIVAHPQITGTLCASGAGLSRPAGMASETDLCVAYCLQGNMIGREDKNGPQGSGVRENASFALNTVDRHSVAAVDCRNFRELEETSGTLQSKTTPGYSLNHQNPIRTGYIVRRLTPTECERLQGYKDGWTAFGDDEKPISDTRRYQMLGNSVAIPCVAYVLEGIAKALGNEEVDA